MKNRIATYMRRTKGWKDGIEGYIRVVGADTEEQVEDVLRRYEIQHISPPFSHPNFMIPLRVYFCMEKAH